MHPIIVGGGVAGLAAAVRLADHGIYSHVIEGGTFPAHKVCGEFFSPEIVPLLERWDLAPSVKLQTICLHGFARRPLQLSLEVPAASQSRYDFDASLAGLATKRGVQIVTQTFVTELIPPSADGLWHVQLSTGERLTTPCLLLGVGRLVQQFLKGPPVPLPYVGFKTHLKQRVPNALHLFSVRGGYFGLSPVDENHCNVAFLLRKEVAPHRADTLRWLLPDSLMEAPTRFDWMRVEVPPFGARPMPLLPGLFLIGDAAAAIPPVSGQGLSMGLSSGILAADYAVHNDAMGYRKAWQRRYRARLRWASWLNAALLSPARRALIPLGTAIPGMVRLFYGCTREPSVKPSPVDPKTAPNTDSAC